MKKVLALLGMMMVLFISACGSDNDVLTDRKSW